MCQNKLLGVVGGVLGRYTSLIFQKLFSGKSVFLINQFTFWKFSQLCFSFWYANIDIPNDAAWGGWWGFGTEHIADFSDFFWNPIISCMIYQKFISDFSEQNFWNTINCIFAERGCLLSRGFLVLGFGSPMRCYVRQPFSYFQFPSPYIIPVTRVNQDNLHSVIQSVQQNHAIFCINNHAMRNSELKVFSSVHSFWRYSRSVYQWRWKGRQKHCSSVCQRAKHQEGGSCLRSTEVIFHSLLHKEKEQNILSHSSHSESLVVFDI